MIYSSYWPMTVDEGNRCYMGIKWAYPIGPKEFGR